MCSGFCNIQNGLVDTYNHCHKSKIVCEIAHFVPASALFAIVCSFSLSLHIFGFVHFSLRISHTHTLSICGNFKRYIGPKKKRTAYIHHFYTFIVHKMTKKQSGDILCMFCVLCIAHDEESNKTSLIYNALKFMLSLFPLCHWIRITGQNKLATELCTLRSEISAFSNW